MTNFRIAILFLSLVACQSIPEEMVQEAVFASGNAQWLEDARELPASDSLFYLDHPAPLFRKAFHTGQAIKNARLFITAAGYYKAFLNGERIGDNVLDPAWTDFSKRVYYSEYDVTSLINTGDNCLGVALGNGFYNPLPLRKWGARNMRNDLSKVGKPTFLAKLVISYENGHSEEIVSDADWKYAYGPLLKNSVYLGVTYDARKEIDRWDTPGFDDQTWQSAKTGTGPGGDLQKAFFPPVQITEQIDPIRITALEEDSWMVDMGVNFTGTYRIKLSGNAGDTIVFRFGERLYEDGTLNPMTAVIGQIKRKGVGGPGAPDIAWQTDSYILNDEAEQWFEPEFTYHTYRYMEIRGLEQKPELSDVKGLFMHSNLESNNSFVCSSELLNAIQEATERTFRANLVSVQSDCPAREKFGYGGDLNATNESFIYNYDMQAFYRKTIYDWVDAMNDTVFVDTAPFVGIQYCGISWESAFLITQYYLYLYYNDTDIIKELYELDQEWMEKVARIHPEGMVDQGLSDHESLAPVPVGLTGTAHYLQCARIMKTFANLMGDRVNEEKYDQLATHLQQLIKARYWDQPVREEINRQTLFATLLYHDIVPADEIPAAKDSLLQAVQNGPAGHFITGIFGTKYVLETMSEYLSPELVFDIVNSTAYPGWGHMIDRGATTIWETWKESDNTYSNCHPMFGTVTEWYYRRLAGIRPDPAAPGFERFTLAPSIPDGLDFVNCTYQSPHGPIVSNWQKTQTDAYRYEVSIPEGSTANISLPLKESQQIEIKAEQAGNEPEMTNGSEKGKFTLQAGRYTILVTPVK
jgi:alpha-L-rhamnosidase